MSDHSGEESSVSSTPHQEYGSGRAFPLSSRRLTLTHLHAIAQALKLPTSASGEDILLMIEGKLGEMGRNPRTVQVCTDNPVPGGGSGIAVVGLQDQNGLFLKIERDMPWFSVQEEDHCLEIHPLDDNFSAVSGESESPEQTELARILETCQLELQSLKEVLAHERERACTLQVEVELSTGEASRLREELQVEKDKVSGMWQMHCSQLARWDAEGAERDAEIAQLKARIAVLEKAGRVSLPVTTVGVASHVVSTSTHFTPSVTTSSRCFVLPSYTCWSSVPSSGVSSSHLPLGASTGHLPVPGSVMPPSSTVSLTIASQPIMCTSSTSASLGIPRSTASGHPSTAAGLRRGKAPPVDNFTGEDSAVRWEDWLPTLERAATWNGWSDEESLMQLAGRLRGRALVEWNLLSGEEKSTYSASKQALHARLDPGSKVLAAQDFRHAIQKDDESVADFVRRMERCFQVAYGRDNLSR